MNLCHKKGAECTIKIVDKLVIKLKLCMQWQSICAKSVVLLDY